MDCHRACHQFGAARDAGPVIIACGYAAYRAQGTTAGCSGGCAGEIWKKALTYAVLMGDLNIPCDGRDLVKMPGLMYSLIVSGPPAALHNDKQCAHQSVTLHIFQKDTE